MDSCNDFMEESKLTKYKRFWVYEKMRVQSLLLVPVAYCADVITTGRVALVCEQNQAYSWAVEYSYAFNLVLTYEIICSALP